MPASQIKGSGLLLRKSMGLASSTLSLDHATAVTSGLLPLPNVPTGRALSSARGVPSGGVFLPATPAAAAAPPAALSSPPPSKPQMRKSKSARRTLKPNPKTVCRPPEASLLLRDDESDEEGDDDEGGEKRPEGRPMPQDDSEQDGGPEDAAYRAWVVQNPQWYVLVRETHALSMAQHGLSIG
jgi:hypothetical protein